MRFSLKGNIPRGTIYHSVLESIKYLFLSIFSRIDKVDKISHFERVFGKYCEREYCVAFPFARTSIYFILKSLDLPKGSEIILPPITIKGIVDVVIDLGYTPVYVELDKETMNFDLDNLKQELNSNTKVAIVTHLFGLVPDMGIMMKLLKEHKVFVIEDFSQCLNGCFGGKRVGTFGDVGVYSSSSIKSLDTLGGGLTVTNDRHLHEYLRASQQSLSSASRKFLISKAWINMVRNVATSPLPFSVLTFPVLQILRKINPESALKQTGHRNKSRLPKLPKLWFRQFTSVQADIGLSQIKSVSVNDRARITNAELVKLDCENASFPFTTKESSNVYWQLILLVPNAFEAQEVLAKQGIDSATSSLELISSLEEYPNKEDLPVAQNIYTNGIYIPCYPHLSNTDLNRIISAVKSLC